MRAEVIGDPVAQSKSPAIHGFWIESLGLDAAYGCTRVAADGLTAHLDGARRDAAWRGCNVTMPLKEAVLPHLDRVALQARRVGAVNTVTRASDGALVGRNTDIAGFLKPLAEVLAETHYFRMARIVGTGGAARAIVVALAEHGFTLVLAGRDPGKARAILDELAPGGEHHAVSLYHFASPTAFAFDDRKSCLDLVVNASPLGMAGQPPLRFDWSHAPPGSIAYDIVTDPVQTCFLRDAAAAGFRTVDGLAMLIGQAAAAFRHFYGIAAPRERDKELRARLLA